MRSRTLSVMAVLALMAASSGCGMLSSPLTTREQTAGIGALAGGATGAIIGSFAGSALAGGLFGMPIGAVAGYYIGDQMSRDRRSREARNDEQDRQLAELRQENERLKREEKSSAQAAAPKSEQPATKAAPATASNAPAKAVVAFDFNKSTINGDAQPSLNPIITWLKGGSDRNVAVVGYTDDVGSGTYNMKLSERRAKAVSDYLVKSGVDKEDIEVRGMGEASPVADNETKAGRDKNRRVEIVPNGGMRTASAAASQ